MAEAYGRHRDSIADIEGRLHDIICGHPEVHIPEDGGEPCVPSRAMADIFRTFQAEYGGTLVDEAELDLISQFVENSPSIDVVTPSMLLAFVAQKTSSTPSPPMDNDNGMDDTMTRSDSRHSSSDSIHTSNGFSGSRPPSRGPPQTPKSTSAFDKRLGQRAPPLTPSQNAPSSWARPTPKRRKSDASGGSRSDSESSGPPSSFTIGRSGGRTRAPSNPTAPSYDDHTMSPPGSARSFSSASRPGSRSGRQGGGYSSPEEGYDPNTSHEHFMASISSLPLPRHLQDDDEHDSDDDTMGLIHDRRASMISLEDHDKIEVLQKTNDELARKLYEIENTLTQRITEHENELEDSQARLDEVHSELAATKKEEKELRSKERINQSQISELENEMNKATKQLENSRATYITLNRIYQDQVASSEQYRNDLREREREIMGLREAVSLHEVEAARFAQEQGLMEDRIHRLENDLDVAARAQEELDQQKQENLLLKETIDRMKFDLDELRNKENWATGSSGPTSAANSISKSLGAELSAKLKDGRWNLDPEEDARREEILEEEDDITEGEEDEDVVQTIITRKKRKVASRANQIDRIETRTFEEIKEYSDSSTQYDPTPFQRTGTTQTDPEPKVITASATIQTETASFSTSSIQTDSEPEPVPIPLPSTGEMQIQTDEVEDEAGSSSSSSTVLAPTPKPLVPPELPPAYGEEPDMRSTMETLKQWHQGADLPPSKSIHISPEVAAEWRALKKELGIGCSVIDQSIVVSSPSEGSSNNRNKRRSGKFYNIYNTYVYDKGSNIPHLTQALMWGGALGLVMYANLLLTYPHPGAGPTLHDRYAWQSYNYISAAGEGFGGALDGMGTDNSAVWGFLGRVGGGAARIARGWPT